MRTLLLFMIASLLLVLGACAAQPQPQAQAPPPFRPTATIKDIMDSVVDPNADFIWESIATTVSAKGIEEKRPRTDDEWREVRRRAIALLEASNLLLVPDRHVAKPGEKSENPGIELGPEEIEGLINKDKPTFIELALTLHDAVVPALKAIDEKNPDALLNAGDLIDRACEGCHLKYWYPNDQEAQRQYSERLKLP